MNEVENTHDWEFRIKDAEDGDMRHYVEKIVIHSNTKKPRRIKGQ